MSQEELAIKDKIKPILEQMVYYMVIDRPQNPVNFMIEHLQKLGKYTSNGLTVDEKLELETLRKEIKKYREMEETNETDNIHDKSLSDEEEDDVDDHIEKKVINAKARMTKQREAVSAEAYGIYNKKELLFQKKSSLKKRGFKSFILFIKNSNAFGISFSQLFLTRTKCIPEL